jgi:hypothetical protein
MTQPATVGSELLYTYQASDHCKKQAVGQSRPALVVRDWGGCYNVQVFTDGVNDFDDKRMTLHVTSVQLSGCVAKGRLHWPGSPVEVEAPQADPEPAEPAPAAEAPNAVLSLGEDGLKLETHEPEPIQTTIAPPAVAKRKPGRPKKVK